ncbi:MAG: tRNA lysidine(34) synthetase TilS [Candidatus Caenarcaniphilales bacterium]|nr:tRNA lysidine(34) synthetase TilS [Candidatus Caenarcaniphilales bacterium]
MTKEKSKINFNHQIPLEGTLIVACSGGPDSMALLHYAKKNLTNEIICAHFNHRWSASSEKAKKIVERLCSDLKITIVHGNADAEGKTSEDNAREERYKFLYKVAKENKAKFVLTAHHKDDQIETFFLRILRGTGSAGLECIPQTRRLNADDEKVLLVRPLLITEKSDLHNYCHDHNIFFYEDPSNKMLDIKRNQIRSQLIPLVQRIEPNYKKRISNLIEMLRAQNEFLVKSLSSLNEENIHCCKSFARLDKALQRIIIKNLLEEKDVSTNFDLIESLIEGIISRQNLKLSIGAGYFFESNSSIFRVTKQPSKKTSFFLAPLKFELKPQKIEIPNIGTFIVREENLKPQEINKLKNSNLVHVDLSSLSGGRLVLRGRKPGDRFQPINMPQSTRLKSFLTNRKVKQRLGDEIFERLALLTSENSSEILWIPGVEIGDKIKVKTQSSHSLEFIPVSVHSQSQESVKLKS